MEGILGKLGGFDPATQGLLSAAFRGMQLSGPSVGKPVSMGQVIGGAGEAGMGSYSQAQKMMLDEAYRTRLAELEKVQLDMARQTLAHNQRKDSMLMGLLGLGDQPAGASGAAPAGVLAGGGMMPTSGSPAAPAAPGGRPGALGSPMGALAAQGLGLTGAVDMYKHLNTPDKVGPGDYLIPRNGGAPTAMPGTDGLVRTPAGISRPPGAGLIAQMEGEKAAAIAGAQARLDPYKIEPTSPGESARIVPRASLFEQPAAAPAPAPFPAPGPRPSTQPKKVSLLDTTDNLTQALGQTVADYAEQPEKRDQLMAAYEKLKGELGKRGVKVNVPLPDVQAKPGIESGLSENQKAEVKATGAALEAKYKNDAERVAGLEQKLPSLHSTMKRLDRLETLTKDDKTYAAAGAELKTQLGSIAQSFGLEVNKTKTANSEEYIAHIAELMKDRLASKDYGSGSGVSNLDLLSAAKPLPELAKTQQGRMQIISAIRADTNAAITDSTAARDHFAKNNSLRDFRYPSETRTPAPTSSGRTYNPKTRRIE